MLNEWWLPVHLAHELVMLISLCTESDGCHMPAGVA